MVNNKISKKGTFGTTMGIASIIAILVILVLIVFASLSIMTAKADYRLSQKAAEVTTAYYAADSIAEDHAAVISALAKKGTGWEKRLGGEYKVSTTGGAITVSYSVPMDGDKKLDVMLGVDADGKISRKLWQVNSTTEWHSNNDIKLMIE